MNLDVLAIGAHPDDVDLGVGGTLHRMAAAGRKVGILDLTLGELSSRGTTAERETESQEAAAILGVSSRTNAGLPDGQLMNIPAQRAALIPLICTLKPRIILAPMAVDRHPDHRAAHALVRDANFFAGVKKAAAPNDPHRAAHIYYYHAYHQDRSTPAFIIDITDSFETKLKALGAYRSQLHNPKYDGQPTYVSSEAFWNGIRTRAEYWGGRIGVPFGEPFYSDEPLALENIPGLGVHA